MKNILKNKTTRTNMITYLVVIAAFAIMQTMSSMNQLSYSVQGYLVPVCCYIVLAVSLNLLVGVCGELSLGHAGFMGIGAFSGIVVASLLGGFVENDTVRLIAALICGGVMAGIIGFLIGIPVLRLRGDYLAIVTLAFGEIMKNIISNLYVGMDSGKFFFILSATKPDINKGAKMFINGAMGATGVSRISTFAIGFVLIMFTLFVVMNLINSKEGRAIKAIRDNRIAAESVGINVTAFRMKAFVVSAFLAGMAGALYGLNYSATKSTTFGFTTSINILVFVVLGGMGNVLGSVISAAALYVLPEMMRGLEDYRMIIYAVVLIVVMLCTWSPKVKGAIQVLKSNISDQFKKIFRKKKTNPADKEVGSDE